jgi:hypothetical protein
MQAAEHDAMLRRERLAVKEVRSIPSGEPPFFPEMNRFFPEFLGDFNGLSSIYIYMLLTLDGEQRWSQNETAFQF